MTVPKAVVLVDRDEPDARRIAAAVRQALGLTEAAESEPRAQGGTAPSGDGVEPSALERVDVAVVLDVASAARARAAGVPRIVALFPFLDVDWEAELEADLVLVAHEALIPDAVERGAPRSRVRCVGPIAPVGWAPSAHRASLRESLEIKPDHPAVVVRAAALDPDDLAPAIMQLSLVRRTTAWLFDVGLDAALAKILRREVPGYGLDARMFAEGPDALRAYQAADVVLGRLEGPEAIRAFSVGAALAATAPSRRRMRSAHVIERAGLAIVADAAATLAVTLDAACALDSLGRLREASAALGAPGGAARAADLVRALVRGELGPPVSAAGLPVGLERLSEPQGFGARGSGEHVERVEEEGSIDEELAALRKKLGL